MSLINPDYKKRKTKPLKKSKTGMEIEFHLINKKGEIVNDTSQIIASLEKEKNIQVTKEMGRSIIEFGCYPSVETYNPALDLISSIQKAVEICEKEGLLIYPFGTYPGKFNPEFSEGERYKLQEKIFGKEKASIACQAVGFHHHYAFPKGVFDCEEKMVRVLQKGKLGRSLIASYNFEIAADPVLTLLTQSSPFYQGHNLAKDSRMIIYRGGRKLKFMEGLYANHQQIGGLPPYKQTTTDLLMSLKKRWRRWEKEIRSADPNSKINELYPFKLDITWNPVKLNKHGTIEQRGMDTNYLSILVAVTVLLKFCLKEIQRKFYEVVPADFAIKEPFKIENGILYVPPHTYVRNKLQRLSAYEGFANQEMYDYVKKFFNFAQSVTPKRYKSIIKPVKDMIEHKQSMSDKILKYARWKGFLKNGKISDSNSAELALHYAEQFAKDLEETRKKLEKISSL